MGTYRVRSLETMEGLRVCRNFKREDLWGVLIRGTSRR